MAFGEMDFAPQKGGDTGFGAVNFLNAQNMPPQLKQQLAIAQARLQNAPQLPTDAVRAGSDLNGLTPEAQQALRALLVRNLGQSANPGADTRLQQAVDLAYGTK